MTVQHLYDTYFDSWSEAEVGTQVVGMRFKCSVSDMTITGLRWRRMATGSNRTPVKLAIWDTTTGGVVAEPSTIVDSGAAGWQVSSLSSPFTPVQDRVYVVAAGWNATSYRGNASTTTPAAPPSPFSWGPVGPGAYQNGSNSAYPDTSINVYVPVDIETGDWSPPAPDDTDQISYAELRDELVRWLSASATPNTHENDLPWVTRSDVSAVKTVTDRLNDIGNAAVAWLNDRSSDAVNLLNEASQSWVDFLNAAGSRLTGSSGAGGSAFYAPSGQSIGLNTDEILALLQLLVATQRNAMDGFPASPWVMAGETTFDTSLAWAESADLYVVSFTDLGSNVVNTVAAGVDISYRLAWWSPLIGSAIQTRRFIDTPDAHLWLDGQRMPGLLLHSPRGASGSVQAWIYS